MHHVNKLYAYFSVATTPWFHLGDNNANNVRINCSCERVEPRTRCNIIIPTFWVSDNKTQYRVFGMNE